MPNCHALEPAVDPNNRVSFLLDWELTMKCNLDCNYCPSDLYGGHDNSTAHPDLDRCIKALEFMFAYVDLYMDTKPRGIKYVMLNVYGGESLHHPDIETILSQIPAKYEPYRSRWHLTVTTTTNAIVSSRRLQKILPYIDEFTVSYHAQNTAKHKQQFKENLLTIAQAGRRQKCIIMMDPDNFQDCEDMIRWCQDHDIKYLPKQIDGHYGSDSQRVYQENQVQWFDLFYKQNTRGKQVQDLTDTGDVALTDLGRACCGGRQLCVDQDYRQRQAYVSNKFYDWYCSVNHFFVFVKQVTEEIFVNKDCKMRFDGTVGPIGKLHHSEQLLAELAEQIQSGAMPTIQCKKASCFCGLCAPKAQNMDTYGSIMKKYIKDTQICVI